MAENTDRTYTIGELARAAETTARTVRFYQAEGLLPPAGTRGRYTVYSQAHLDRLRLIQQLKRAYLPLSAIRAQLERLTPDQLRLLAAPDVHVVPEDATEAVQYVADLLGSLPLVDEGGAKKGRTALWVSSRKESKESDADMRTEKPVAGIETAEAWERWQIADGIELHVRIGANPRADLAARVQAIRDLFERP